MMQLNNKLDNTNQRNKGHGGDLPPERKNFHVQNHSEN